MVARTPPTGGVLRVVMRGRWEIKCSHEASDLPKLRYKNNSQLFFTVDHCWLLPAMHCLSVRGVSIIFVCMGVA